MSYLTSPTVLIVDDQPRFGRELKKALLNFGSIGAIFVPSLGKAADIIEEGRYTFDAVLTDVTFEVGQDQERELFDGLDLVKFVQERHPHIERYAYTAAPETSRYQGKVLQRELDIRKFFDKRKIDLEKRRSGDTEQPWAVVRADIIRKNMRRDPSLIEQVEKQAGKSITDEGLLELVVETLMPPTVTYLQSLDNRFNVTRPIQVVCTPAEDGGVKASAPQLGILVDAFGTTPADAVESLREIIASHAEALLAPGQESDLRGYSKLVRDELLRHLELAKEDAA